MQFLAWIGYKNSIKKSFLIIQGVYIILYFSDINQVCISGVGSSMIKNASSQQKVSLNSMLGSNAPNDAVDLVNQLLIFNPHKRLTAEGALGHEYVTRFHDPQQEIVLHSTVTIPINDDIRLSVDDYRNKLYELMSSHHHKVNVVKPLSVKPKLIVPEVYSKVSKNAEKYIKSHVNPKEKSYISHSEPKMHQKAHWSHTAHIRSDSKVINHQNLSVPSKHRIESIKAGGDTKPFMKSNSEVPKKRIISSNKSNFYTSFNSFNKNHGIITQSALIELKTAGYR